MKNIWSKHSGKFSTTLQAALNQSVHSTMYEYDEPIFTALKEPHDPFPDDSLLAVNRDFAIKNWGWQVKAWDIAGNEGSYGRNGINGDWGHFTVYSSMIMVLFNTN